MAIRRFSRGAARALLLVEHNMRGDIEKAIAEIDDCIKARSGSAARGGGNAGRDRAVKARVLVEGWRNGWADAKVLDHACKLAKQGCKEDDGDYYTHWKRAYADKYRARSGGWNFMVEALAHYDDALAKIEAEGSTDDALRSVLIDRAETFVYLSQADVAVREMERALKLRGKTQDWHVWAYAFALHQNGDYKKSAAQLAPFFRGNAAKDFYYNDMKLLLAASLARAGKLDQAQKEIREFRRNRDQKNEPVWTIRIELERGAFFPDSSGEKHWRESLKMLDAKALPR
jgi:tetratricopeptide (TPR) repeat protein